jgi:valyl-tRNA synthetase
MGSFRYDSAARILKSRSGMKPNCNKPLEIEDNFENRMKALMGTYKLVWDDFCSWFLEMIKPAYMIA